MAWLLCITCILVCGPELLQGKASEYQLESETRSQCELLRAVAVAEQQGGIPQCTEGGRFRPVQCSGRGHECWCVDAKGQEVVGTRTNSSAPHCPSPCQLQSVLRCSASGLFESVQCESSRGQCWCVDQDGMELYGTRQSGTPQRCPGSCEVRGRRLLHGSAPRSPPQCAADGSFLPVQCQFINTTDRREVDLLHAFNSFPEAFETFSSFRKFFPMVSSFCFCSDSRGRELENTGVELLLSDVYDSSFSGLRSGRSVSQTSVYLVLQRRMLGVRLALTGHFRCPSPCEEERRAAASGVFVPSCDDGGRFSSRQCQQGGQCWCVDPTGRERPGTRQLGDALVCSSGLDDCLSQRRRALSRLFSGPVAPPLLGNSSGKSPASSCLSLLRPLRDVLPVEADPTSFLSRLVEVLQGLFPSVGGAVRALSGASSRRLQENLFGGKFLKNAAALNLSGAVGARGALGLERLSSLSLMKNRDLVRYVSRALEDDAFLSALRRTLTGLSSSLSLEQVLTPLLRSCSAHEDHDGAAIFVPSCKSDGGFREVQCQGGGACWCVDPQGREVAGSRSSGRRPRCPSRCERERAAALEVKGNMAAGAEIHIPACSEDGDFLPLQCVGSRCFCVNAEGRPMTAGPTGGAVTCPDRQTQNLQSFSGHCARALAEVTAFTEQAKGIVALSGSSHLPLGYGFLLADGLRLTADELQVRRSQEELQISETLLSRSNAALQLAAYSTVQMFLPPQRRSYLPFTPQCDADGQWLYTQCYHSTGQCWCVDEEGDYVPNSLTSRSLSLPKCQTRCQRARARTVLSGWTKGSDITASSPYQPKCEEDGRYSVLQTGGAAGWCVNPLTGDWIQTATRGAAGQLTCPSWCELQGRQCRPDGSFVPLQCDVTSCWCVSMDGQEVGGTRMPVQTGRTPSCDRPLCPDPVVTHGALLCRPAADGRQSCDLVCHHGYHNTLPVGSFLCETEGRRWDGADKPLSGACQISQPLQSVSFSQFWSLSSPCSQISSLQSQLFSSMTSRGLCSAQLPVSGHSVMLCDESSVRLQCDGDESMTLTVTWTAALSDLPTSDLPDLHDIGLFLNESRLLDGVQGLLGNISSTLVSVTTPSFGCSRGYHLAGDGEGCVVCPAGSFSREGVCLLCPQGTYQDEEGRGFCNSCPRGSSPAGASSVDQCVTECQRQGLRCSERGDFLSGQPDFLSGRWRCVSSEGAKLEWTDSDKALTDEECSVLGRFQSVPGSDLIVGAEDTEVLRTMTSDLKACVQACAAEPSCLHVALFNTQCELYSTHTLNTHCNTSQQTSGFLGNPQAELFDWLNCSPRVRGGSSDLLVIRKKGAEFPLQQQRGRSLVRMRMTKAVSGVFRTQVFSGHTSLSDAHRFCQDGCDHDTCCDGFILNQNRLHGGSVLCGWLRTPSVLMCGDQDWDVIGQGAASRICGAGLSYNEQQRSFVFDFGGQEFTITDSALPADSKKKKDYQASIVSFQAVYLNTGADSAAGSGSGSGSGSSSCAAAELPRPLDSSVQRRFESLSEDDVLVDPQRNLSVLSFWLNKKNYDSQQALLWCLTRCVAERRCSVADLRDADSTGFFSCSLFPDTRVCGAYDKPLRRACRLLLDRSPNNTYSRTVDLSGPVKSFYERVSFQKMVSYSVRSRVSVRGNTPLSEGFQSVPGSDLIVGAEDTEVLRTMTSDLKACVQACAAEPSCLHVALFNTQCELYSTHTLNTHCNTSQQTSGFLGNPQAELFDWLNCSPRVRGGSSDLLVIRKKGAEFPLQQQRGRSLVRMRMTKAVSGVFRTQVFSGHTSLSDAHRFCQDGCDHDTCCDGFILNQNRLHGGSVLCGWLRTPSVLMCGDQDWDVIGQGAASRICGAGLSYNEQQRSFVFDFGGQEFTITDSALPADSKKKKDYQASIVSFQAVYLNTGADSAAGSGSGSGSGSSSCAAAELPRPLDSSVQRRFESLSEDDVLVDPQRNLSVLSFWLNKKNYDSQQALLWCLTRCVAERRCSVADLRDADSTGFFSCSLFPDTRVCGAYDKPLRRACRLLLDRSPNNTYSRTVDLSGPVKSFYERVSFQKMVSYSVRSRVSVRGNTPLSEGFMQCERRCDEDPCCRGIGFVRDTESPGGADVVCLSLISLGVQTCGEDHMTSWRTQDCRPSAVKTSPDPFGWYLKPVNQWSSAPALCPSFSLSPRNVSLDEWRLLSDSSVLVDPSVSTYDIIHISRDIATDRNKTRDWCLHACQEAESCVAVSLSEVESASRCVLYPDTTACGLSSAPGSSRPSTSCRLVIREPAPQVYLRTERSQPVTTVSVPGHGILQGVAVKTTLGSDQKTVLQFLGVPYARPPIGSLRFQDAQPADWTGTWDATKPRPSCLQPGDAASSSSSSENCLYLNIFSPAAQRGRVPVLVFFFNPSASQKPGLLDGSTLAAVGNIVVVTAHYRTAALGFLSTGESGLPGNYGLSDQEAVLRWVNAHISLMGGDNSRVTVGAERGGADMTSLHLLVSSSLSPPLFQRMMLMGGSVFSPSLLHSSSSSSSRQQTLDLAKELGCVTSDLVACLRTTPVDKLNAAQTKLLAVSGPFRSWSPVLRRSDSPLSLRGVDLLLGSLEQDGLIVRARRVKDFEALQGRADGKTAFYEALRRSLGGEAGSELLKEAASWFYSLDHGPSPAGYNLFSRALDNATRDLFITCPGLRMASHWANGGANVFLYHQPASAADHRADASVPLDVQFVFGTPHHPISSQRFPTSGRRLSLAMMTYVSSFVRTGNPNPSRVWEESVLPRWQPVQSSEATPTYLEISPALRHRQGLRQKPCSFWSQMGTRLSQGTGESLEETFRPVLILESSSAMSQSQAEKDTYS